MNSKIIGLLFVSMLMLQLGYGQNNQLRTVITITDSSFHSTTIEFGVDPNATYCIDSQLGEFELPPGACTGTGLCTAFKDIRTDSSACMGEGLILDLRTYVSSAQVDTYRIVFNFQNYPVTFRWPSDLGTYYDSVKIIDELGGVFINTNMIATDSLVMASSLVSSLKIFAWGPKLMPTSVRSSETISSKYHLLQNYPNPFNPKTEISFNISDGGLVKLKIYDVFGREQATLVNTFLTVGAYAMSWDASNKASGVYYYTLQTGSILEVRTMILAK